MKIGIISDTHGCAATWRAVFSRYLIDADLIIHAGDVLYHGPRNAIPAEYDPMALARELNGCPVPLVIACGNCDADVDAMVLDTPLQAPYAHVFADGHRIIVNHGHNLTEDTKWEVAKKMQANLLITGHTHLASLERKNCVVCLNPGSPAMSKQEDKRGTIAVMIDGMIEVIAIDSGEVLAKERL